MFKAFKQFFCKHHFVQYEMQHLHIAECVKCGVQFPH